MALIALGVPLALSLQDRVNSEVRSQAQSQAQVVATSAAELIEPPRHGVLTRLARASAASVRGRVIVVDAQGKLLADSAGEPVGTSYADRPEVRSALRGHGEQITRDSETLGTEILATSMPVFEHGRPRGAVRITQSVAAVNRAIRTSILDVVALGAIVLAMGLVVGWLIAAQIARPIRRLDQAAQRVAGGDLGVEAVVEGSSEQRSLARTFNEMTGRVRRLLRVQQDFVADASHQLRTPLTGLRLRLEALGERFRGDPPAVEEVDAAMLEIDRLSHMVDELLILSRAGEHDRPGEAVDLGDVARRATERWRAAATAHGVELELGRDGAPATAWIAPPDLDRALDAVVENALLYSPAGSTVTIGHGAASIEVLDRGPGLAPGEEEAVFERFRRGSAGRAGPTGTGLGLAIAREMTRQWGGDVRLEPREGGGLRAVVEVGG
ncbi:MAG: HAMP domain-containing protein [Actinobacteria bacterium]|nr:HAMP domain-containing protein [Actinomycetota bacterium]